MAAPVPLCQYCKTPLLWLNEANQWYCPKCRIYPFIQRKDELSSVFDNIGSSNTYYCPHCGQTALVWYPQYQRWYCFVCRNYK
ncbi:MAG: CpXC domain-containing protein [Thermoplasmata archaeon]|nr:CpXC domain-containing protein [Thermoplasmata archaeon]